MVEGSVMLRRPEPSSGQRKRRIARPGAASRTLSPTEGPDIFLGLGPTKVDCSAKRPTREQWSGQTALDNRGMNCLLESRRFAPWTTKDNLGGRSSTQRYNHHTRRYCAPFQETWTGAIWQPEPYKNRKLNPYPEAVRSSSGQWYQDRRYLPQFLGGPTCNEYACAPRTYYIFG